MKSFAAEVIADNSGKFCGNALRFATREEAERYAKDLMNRWMLVREWRVVESNDPVTDRLTRKDDGVWLIERVQDGMRHTTIVDLPKK